MSVKEEAAFQVHEANHSELCFVIFSDLHLDHAKTMSAFATVLQGYVDADFIPFALVLCGNFASQQYSSADMMQRYKAGFAALGDTLSSFPSVVRTSHIILVPGPQDPFSSSLVPRPALPEALVQPLLSKLKALQGTVHLASNPCRISYFSQQLVVYRDDTMFSTCHHHLGMAVPSRGDAEEHIVGSHLGYGHVMTHDVRWVGVELFDTECLHGSGHIGRDCARAR